MKQHKQLPTFFLAVGLAVIMVTSAVSRASASTISLSPSSGSVGISVKVNGNGFAGFTSIEYIYIYYDEQLVATATPTTGGLLNDFASGNSFIVPSSSFGAHTVLATQQNKYGSTYQGSATFTVTSVPAVTMTVSYNGATPTPPVFHYQDTLGSNQTYTLTTSPYSLADVGAGLPWSVDNPVGSGLNQWSTGTSSGTAPESDSQTIVFVYSLISYSTSITVG